MSMATEHTTMSEENNAEKLTESKAKSGCFVFANGDQYEGEYEQNDEESPVVKSGHGKYTCQDGTLYMGTWKSDGMVDHGSVIFTDQSRYVGQFDGPRFHGYGRYCWPDGSYLEGIFINNKISGAGRYVDVYGQEWHGSFNGRRAEGLKFHLKM